MVVVYCRMLLRCNKYTIPQGENNMDFQSLAKGLRDLLAYRSKSEVEKYIESKNPKTAADVEHWLQQYTYDTKHDWFTNA